MPSVDLMLTPAQSKVIAAYTLTGEGATPENPANFNYSIETNGYGAIFDWLEAAFDKGWRRFFLHNPLGRGDAGNGSVTMAPDQISQLEDFGLLWLYDEFNQRLHDFRDAPDHEGVEVVCYFGSVSTPMSERLVDGLLVEHFQRMARQAEFYLSHPEVSLVFDAMATKEDWDIRTIWTQLFARYKEYHGWLTGVEAVPFPHLDAHSWQRYQAIRVLSIETIMRSQAGSLGRPNEDQQHTLHAEIIRWLDGTALVQLCGYIGGSGNYTQAVIDKAYGVARTILDQGCTVAAEGIRAGQGPFYDVSPDDFVAAAAAAVPV